MSGCLIRPAERPSHLSLCIRSVGKYRARAPLEQCPTFHLSSTSLLCLFYLLLLLAFSLFSTTPIPLYTSTFSLLVYHNGQFFFSVLAQKSKADMARFHTVCHLQGRRYLPCCLWVGYLSV